jgi:hypothetical protein
MKAFKKLALVTAIAAAPFAQAELVSIDDSVLSDMTGQAGISIELSAQVSIGSVNYTDTDGLTGALPGEAGTLGLNNIVLGGNNGSIVSGALDEIKIDIDVDANDGLIIHLGGTDTAGVLIGSNKVDFGLSVGDVTINNEATLASNISILGNLGPIDVTIANDSTIGVEAFFEVTSGSLNVDVMGLGITNLTIGDNAAPFINNTNSNYAYLRPLVESGDFGVANNGALVTPATAALDADASGTIETAEWLASGADLNSDGTVTVLEADTALAGGSGAIVAQAAQSPTSGLAGVASMAYVGMTITTADTTYIDGSGITTNITNALSITIDSMAMDIGMDVSMGTQETAGLDGDILTTGDNVISTASIGALSIQDLNLSGTTLKIYGH